LTVEEAAVEPVFEPRVPELAVEEVAVGAGKDDSTSTPTGAGASFC
jgi:hypothetical protein